MSNGSMSPGYRGNTQAYDQLRPPFCETYRAARCPAMQNSSPGMTTPIAMCAGLSGLTAIVGSRFAPVSPLIRRGTTLTTLTCAAACGATSVTISQKTPTGQQLTEPSAVGPARYRQRA